MTIGTGGRLQNRAMSGVIFMLLGLAFYPLSDAFVQYLMGTYTVHQTTFLRALMRSIPLLIAACFQGGLSQLFRTSRPGRHAVRLVVTLAYTYAFMYSFSTGSLTVIYTLGYTSPFFLILLGAFFLKEKVGRERWIVIAVGMTGVLIALRPGLHVFEPGAVIVLIAVFLGALNKILMKNLSETESILSIAVYPNLMMILVSFPFALSVWQPMPWSDWGLFAVLGVLTAAGQYAIAQALRFAQVSLLAPLDYSSFFWVVLLDYALWSRLPDLYVISGALIVVGSNLYILYRAGSEARLVNNS